MDQRDDSPLGPPTDGPRHMKVASTQPTRGEDEIGEWGELGIHVINPCLQLLHMGTIEPCPLLLDIAGRLSRGGHRRTHIHQA